MSLELDEATMTDVTDTSVHAKAPAKRRVAPARFLDQIEFALIESSFSTRQCGLGRTMN